MKQGVQAVLHTISRKESHHTCAESSTAVHNTNDIHVKVGMYIIHGAQGAHALKEGYVHVYIL